MARLSDGKESASAGDGSWIVKSIVFSELATLSISTSLWGAVAVGVGISSCGGECRCGLISSSWSHGGICSGGVGASGAGGSRGVDNGRGGGGGEGVPCLPIRSERKIFRGGGESTFDRSSWCILGRGSSVANTYRLTSGAMIAEGTASRYSGT